MRFHPKTLSLTFAKGVKRPEKSNAIDMLCSGELTDDLSDFEKQDFARNFPEGHVPEPFTAKERREWLNKLDEVCVSSDAFFPFVDNIYRARRSGCRYIASPIGSQNDELVFEASENEGITFVEQSTRLFHH